MTATPGPWRAGSLETPAIARTPLLARLEASREWYAVVADESYTAQVEANAHLMAASPDLLAFAQNFVEICGSATLEHEPALHALVREARAAIKKAEVPL